MLSVPIALLAAPPQSVAPVAHDVRSVLARPLSSMRSANYRVSGRLVRVDEDGKRTSYDIALKVLGAPASLRVFLDVTAPANARAHVLLIGRQGGSTIVQIAHPGDKTPTALPLEQWSDGPAGPGFSYEDFLESQYFWHDQILEADQKYGARDCNVLKSIPSATDHTHYAQVRTWLDKTIGFPVYVEKTGKISGTIKQFTYYGLRQTSGVWSATQVESKLRGTSGSTLLIIERGSANAKLDEKEFEPVKLTQF